jgi:mannitol/fructose-specific phosphotransferase system IIA component (Ntr-type)
MHLSDLFSPERIRLKLEGITKEEILKELIDLLVESYNLDCSAEILEAVCEREMKMSTGIREGIAVPHGKTQCVQGIYGVLGISPAGVDYDALDGKDVKLVFLLVSSESGSDQHLDILKKIAMCVEHQEFYLRILKAESPEQINKILAEYDKRLQGQLQDSGFADHKVI